MRVIIARHGESTANTMRIFSNRQAVHPLTEKGKEQALTLAHRLEGVPFAQIFTSPILRAVETTRTVCAVTGENFTVVDALRELDMGEYEGRGDEQAWEDFSQLWKDWYVNGNHEKRLPGGESLIESRQRGVSFLQSLTAEYTPNDTILCVSHGGLINAVIPGLVRKPTYEYVGSHPLGNTGMVILDWDGTHWVCLQWAEENFTDQP
jgi:broad specificity phosphatase PhoE